MVKESDKNCKSSSYTPLPPSLSSSLKKKKKKKAIEVLEVIEFLINKKFIWEFTKMTINFNPSESLVLLSYEKDFIIEMHKLI